jgi:hypothetical protein
MLISEAFNSMIDYIYDEYASKLNKLEAWINQFPTFAEVIGWKIGGIFPNMVAFTDGHFQNILLPGGQRNKHAKTAQLMMYNCYYKCHCLKYSHCST